MQYYGTIPKNDILLCYTQNMRDEATYRVIRRVLAGLAVNLASATLLGIFTSQNALQLINYAGFCILNLYIAIWMERDL